jgi:hypothetical protein
MESNEARTRVLAIPRARKLPARAKVVSPLVEILTQNPKLAGQSADVFRDTIRCTADSFNSRLKTRLATLDISSPLENCPH